MIGLLTIHPSHGRDEGPIGVKRDNFGPASVRAFYSWKCWCGEWYDQYTVREEARRDYAEHKRTCKWAKSPEKAQRVGV